MKLTDGKKTVDITLQVYESGNWQPDWSLDFFAAGELEYDADADVYTVDSVDHCIEQANDWQQCIGDFIADADHDSPDNRSVEVEWINADDKGNL